MGMPVTRFKTNFKMSVKFYYKEMPLLEKMFTAYLEEHTTDTYEYQEVQAMLNRLYRDEQKNTNAHVRYLEARGFKVIKGEDTTKA